VSVLCERCGQRPAALQVTQIADGVRREHHLCEQCARQEGAFLNPALSLANILGGLMPVEAPGAAADQGEGSPGLACPACGWTGRQIQHTGQMGCPQCYAVFGQWVDPVLRRIHGSNEHRGKIPSRAGQAVRRQRDLAVLRDKLRAAVEREEFETAAQLRDEIRAYEHEKGDA
jgi:protein arginine kinase activator